MSRSSDFDGDNSFTPAHARGVTIDHGYLRVYMKTKINAGFTEFDFSFEKGMVPSLRLTTCNSYYIQLIATAFPGSLYYIFLSDLHGSS